MRNYEKQQALRESSLAIVTPEMLEKMREAGYTLTNPSCLGPRATLDFTQPVDSPSNASFRERDALDTATEAVE